MSTFCFILLDLRFKTCRELIHLLLCGFLLVILSSHSSSLFLLCLYYNQFNLNYNLSFFLLSFFANMTSSFMKNKFPKCFKEDSYSEDEDYSDLQSIQIEDQNSNSLKTLYYMPKQIIINSQSKIFNPKDWNIRDFQIGRHIGKGKYGHVYLARQRKSKHILALKILSKKQIKKEQIINQIHRQLQIQSHLKHENILQLYGFFYDEKKIYIMLEFAEKGELYAIFKQRGRFNEDQVAIYSCQVIKAMRHLHQYNIIHRDLKPQNLLLCSQQTIKLSDFGWSIHTTKSRKTFCGTIDYICPQIIRKVRYDTKLDMWTIGVLTFELNAGYAPFQSKNRQDTAHKIKILQFQFPEHFSDELKDFISKLLVLDPSERMSEDQALNHEYILKHAQHLL